jgi:hypothetical protein
VGLAFLYLNQEQLLAAQDCETAIECLKQFAIDTDELIRVR